MYADGNNSAFVVKLTKDQYYSIHSLVEDDVQVSIYPNPSQSFFNLVSNENIDYVEIYNSLGILLKKIILNETNAIIDISTLINGNYYLRCKSNNKINVSKLIVLR